MAGYRKDHQNTRPTPDTDGVGEGRIMESGPTMKRDIGLVNQAVSRRWPTQKAMRRKIMERLCNAAVDDPDPEVWIPAARVAINADKSGDVIQSPGVSVNVGVHVGDTVRQLLQEPGYLDYARERELSEASQPSVVRSDSNGSQVANGKASGHPGPGTNGHSNGKAH